MYHRCVYLTVFHCASRLQKKFCSLALCMGRSNIFLLFFRRFVVMAAPRMQSIPTHSRTLLPFFKSTAKLSNRRARLRVKRVKPEFVIVRLAFFSDSFLLTDSALLCKSFFLQACADSALHRMDSDVQEVPLSTDKPQAADDPLESLEKALENACATMASLCENVIDFSYDSQSVIFSKVYVELLSFTSTVAFVTY